MKHIMLVEDEVELAQLVRDYLEAAGFEVSMFHDGPGCLYPVSTT